MRGADTFNESLFTLNHLEDFIPADYPLRSIRTMVNEALSKMGPLFARIYESDYKGGRPSIAPEKLLRAMLLQIFYKQTSRVSAAATTPTSPAPIPMQGCTARAITPTGCASWATP